MRDYLITFVLVWLMLGTVACNQAPDDSSKHEAAALGSSQAGQTTQTDTPEAWAAAEANAQQSAKQLIILYTGDTLSTLVANDSFDPPQGGLPALTNAISGYLGEIAAYNRLRVEGEGRDASGLGVDFAARRVGQHPYILLDYGGWERSNDHAGEVYVALQARMFADMSYDAVGALLYERLAPIAWEAYLRAVPDMTLLASWGEPMAAALPVEPLVIREVHGEQWGLVMVPMAPEPEGTRREKVDRMTEHMQPGIERAAELLADTHCRFSVLSAAGGTRETYELLEVDQRFTVVLGVHGPTQIEDGRGVMPTKGPLMLPELAGGGRELGVLHLYFEPDGDVPVQYYFSRKVVEDDTTQPWPYRKLVPAALTEHEQRLDEFMEEITQILKDKTGHIPQ